MVHLLSKQVLIKLNQIRDTKSYHEKNSNHLQYRMLIQKKVILSAFPNLISKLKVCAHLIVKYWKSYERLPASIRTQSFVYKHCVTPNDRRDLPSLSPFYSERRQMILGRGNTYGKTRLIFNEWKYKHQNCLFWDSYLRNPLKNFLCKLYE